MNCQQSQSVLLEYLMEEIAPQEREQIQQHLENCEVCSAELGRLRQTVTLLARGETQEEIPRQIRLVAEPTGWWQGFRRSGAQMALAGSALVCLAIALLALLQTTISYRQGNLEIAFGPRSDSRSAQPVAVSSQTVSAAGMDRTAVLELVAEAMAVSEVRQKTQTAQLVQAAAQQNEERRLRDFREMAESIRYFQAAQTVLWKEQLESEHRISGILQQVGLERPSNPAF
ncbi:MAG: zf-HC2 domain-containing protein [Acidobacteria bacterium]|nr:zf-HC2 domain-containing protein [Acidobacteriota bacterium]